jgi:hypothetical protein
MIPGTRLLLLVVLSVSLMHPLLREDAKRAANDDDPQTVRTKSMSK